MLEALGIVTAPKSRIDARINFMMELILILSTTEDNSKWSSESGDDQYYLPYYINDLLDTIPNYTLLTLY